MMRSTSKNIYSMNPLEEKEETWEERFQRLKDEGKLIPLGNGKWIEADAYVEAMKQASEKFKDVKFLGELEHPNQIVGEVVIPGSELPQPNIELPNASLIDSIYKDAGCVRPSFSQRVIDKIDKDKGGINL